MQLQTGLSYLAASGFLAVASAKVVSYEWEATWVEASPDGFARPVVGINGEWPCPIIEAEVGDIVEVHLTNKLGNETTGIHWHGIHQVSTAYMDGPSAVTQCPLPPDMSMTYRFEADQAGTYWYHSHNLGQYTDGLRGAMVVRDPKDSYLGCYDEEYIITLSDWYNEQTIPLANEMLSSDNAEHHPPKPDVALINDGRSSNYKIEKGKTYRFRVISFATLSAFFLSFGDLDMKVIAMDAVSGIESSASHLRIAPAQRYDFLVTIEEEQNYPFLAVLDQTPDYLDADIPHPQDMNVTGHLVYDAEAPMGSVSVESWKPFDDATFGSCTGEFFPDADKTLVLDFQPCYDDNDIPRMCFNGSPYIDQKVPTLYTAATVGEYNNNTEVYGAVHPFIVEYGDVVDIIVNNDDPAIHPFHLHGHQFEVLTRGERNAGYWPGYDKELINQEPPKRDTVEAHANSYIHLRYKAVNPGVYLFHCHIEWHVAMGLTATIIETPDRLREIKIPQDHIDICEAQGIPASGNAAGNLDDPLDTSDFITEPHTEYTGALYVSGSD